MSQMDWGRTCGGNRSLPGKFAHSSPERVWVNHGTSLRQSRTQWRPRFGSCYPCRKWLLAAAEYVVQPPTIHINRLLVRTCPKYEHNIKGYLYRIGRCRSGGNKPTCYYDRKEGRYEFHDCEMESAMGDQAIRHSIYMFREWHTVRGCRREYS